MFYTKNVLLLLTYLEHFMLCFWQVKYLAVLTKYYAYNKTSSINILMLKLGIQTPKIGFAYCVVSLRNWKNMPHLHHTISGNINKQCSSRTSSIIHRARIRNEYLFYHRCIEMSLMKNSVKW